MLGHLFAKGGSAAVLLFAVALGLWAASVRQSTTGDALGDHGMAATATLMERREIVEFAADRYGQQARRLLRYEATYEYPATDASGARTIERFAEFLSAEAYAAAEVGDTLAIRYLPEDPSRFERGEGDAAAEARALRWLALGAAHLAFLILAFAWRPALRAAMQSRVRVPATGVVERVWGERGDLTVRVRFTDAEGVERRAVLPSVRAPTLLEVGSSFDILHDPHSVMSK